MLWLWRNASKEEFSLRWGNIVWKNRKVGEKYVIDTEDDWVKRVTWGAFDDNVTEVTDNSRLSRY